jgi:hypothetical protein
MAAAAPFAQIVEAANVAATAAERRMEPQILLICGFFPKNWTTTGSFYSQLDRLSVTKTQQKTTGNGPGS